MKPNIKLAEAKTPDGGNLGLFEHDGSFCIRMDGQQLMHSSVSASETLLGDVGTSHLTSEPEANILIGGLGLGFTLKKVLETARADARIQVAELIPEVIVWNREFLSGLNGKCLEDPRVKILPQDVFSLIWENQVYYHAILLDVDNGPTPLIQKKNARLYSRKGLARIFESLKPFGKLAVWSATLEENFAERMMDVGFRVEVVPAKLYPNAKRFAGNIFVGEKSEEKFS
jgi:spermidine synthase